MISSQSLGGTPLDAGGGSNNENQDGAGRRPPSAGPYTRADTRDHRISRHDSRDSPALSSAPSRKRPSRPPEVMRRDDRVSKDHWRDRRRFDRPRKASRDARGLRDSRGAQFDPRGSQLDLRFPHSDARAAPYDQRSDPRPDPRAAHADLRTRPYDDAHDRMYERAADRREERREDPRDDKRDERRGAGPLRVEKRRSDETGEFKAKKFSRRPGDKFENLFASTDSSARSASADHSTPSHQPKSDYHASAHRSPSGQSSAALVSAHTPSSPHGRPRSPTHRSHERDAVKDGDTRHKDLKKGRVPSGDALMDGEARHNGKVHHEEIGADSPPKAKRGSRDEEATSAETAMSTETTADTVGKKLFVKEPIKEEAVGNPLSKRPLAEEVPVKDANIQDEPSKDKNEPSKDQNTSAVEDAVMDNLPSTDITEGITKASPKDPSKAAPKDSSRDSSKDSTNDFSKDFSKEIPKETSRNFEETYSRDKSPEHIPSEDVLSKDVSSKDSYSKDPSSKDPTPKESLAKSDLTEDMHFIDSAETGANNASTKADPPVDEALTENAPNRDAVAPNVEVAGESVHPQQDDKQTMESSEPVQPNKRKNEVVLDAGKVPADSSLSMPEAKVARNETPDLSMSQAEQPDRLEEKLSTSRAPAADVSEGEITRVELSKGEPYNADSIEPTSVEPSQTQSLDRMPTDSAAPQDNNTNPGATPNTEVDIEVTGPNTSTTSETPLPNGTDPDVMDMIADDDAKITSELTETKIPTEAPPRLPLLPQELRDLNELETAITEATEHVPIGKVVSKIWRSAAPSQQTVASVRNSVRRIQTDIHLRRDKFNTDYKHWLTLTEQLQQESLAADAEKGQQALANSGLGLSRRKSREEEATLGRGGSSSGTGSNGGGSANAGHTRRNRDRHSRAAHGDVARSEAEFLEILANLEAQTARDPLVRARLTSAKIPDQCQEPDKYRFVSRNAQVVDKSQLLKRLKTDAVDTFSEQEHLRFVEAFVKWPKEFGRIAEFVGRNFNECVMHYYRTKKQADYKGILLQRTKRKRGRKPRKKADDGIVVAVPETPEISSGISTPLVIPSAKAEPDAAVVDTEQENKAPSPMQPPTMDGETPSIAPQQLPTTTSDVAGSLEPKSKTEISQPPVDDSRPGVHAVSQDMDSTVEVNMSHAPDSSADTMVSAHNGYVTDAFGEWTAAEISQVKALFANHGPSFHKISQEMGKSPESIQRLYNANPGEFSVPQYILPSHPPPPNLEGPPTGIFMPRQGYPVLPSVAQMPLVQQPIMAPPPQHHPIHHPGAPVQSYLHHPSLPHQYHRYEYEYQPHAQLHHPAMPIRLESAQASSHVQQQPHIPMQSAAVVPQDHTHAIIRNRTEAAAVPTGHGKGAQLTPPAAEFRATPNKAQDAGRGNDRRAAPMPILEPMPPVGGVPISPILPVKPTGPPKNFLGLGLRRFGRFSSPFQGFNESNERGAN